MASTHVVTEHESANRTRVALRLADAILDVGGDAATAQGLPRLGWRLVVERAKQLHSDWTPAADYCPSMATIGATLALLRDHEVAPDPFAGFPQ